MQFQSIILFSIAALLLRHSSTASGNNELAAFNIAEPLGQSWTDEWLSEEIEVDAGDAGLQIQYLHLLADGNSVPAQFYLLPRHELLQPSEMLEGAQKLSILFQADIPKDQTVAFTLVHEPGRKRDWQAIRIHETEQRIELINPFYMVVFGLDSGPAPFLVYSKDGSLLMPGAQWPEHARPTGGDLDILEAGPARVVVRQSFHFQDPSYHYTATYTIHANDPWMDIADAGHLGPDSALHFDLSEYQADTVYHPYTYNARTFKAGGPEEDSTLQPPQHPIATLGPIWRDIWYNGGPFAFVYRQDAEAGIGFAAVHGSQWQTTGDVSPESQNLEIHGSSEEPGQVVVRIPVEELRSRRWALIAGPPALRKDLSRLTRSHADIPLDKVRKEWTLEWESDAPEFSSGASAVYLRGHYNQHFFNPTTFPRTVRRSIDQALDQYKYVHSRDLAVLAYIFSDPDYWPGPDYQWTIGNPNFHTDMYNIPLKIGLLMPDHPHAERWVKRGIEETLSNLMRDSYPGGAWAESISYSSFFFHVADQVRLLAEYDKINGFMEWPRMKEVATFLAAMHTPVDQRYGSRQKAPIGDTSPGNYIGELHDLADDYTGVDDRFAMQLRQFPEPWQQALDLGSRAFPGFGAMLRGNAYDQEHESFVTIKAGPARNHYQGDELSFHFCSLGTPLAIDHACHYSPRPWSAAIHNRPDMNDKRPVAVATPLAFETSSVADVFVAEEKTTRISEVPIEPHLCVKPGWEYPTTFLPDDQPWTMRRFVMLVKHDPDQSKIADYLVIRDEIFSPEPVWWNLHVLARSIEGEGPVFRFPGQLGVDLEAVFLEPEIDTIQKREWGWSGKGNLRRERKGDEYVKNHFSRFIPDNFEPGTWDTEDGERTVWLRVRQRAGASQWMVLLIPHDKDQAAPVVERLSPTSAKVTLGDEAETIHLGSDAPHQAAVERDGEMTILIEKTR